MEKEVIKYIIEALIPIITFYLGIVGKKFYQKLVLSKYTIKDSVLFIDIKKNIEEIKRWKVEKNRKVFIDALIIKLDFWYIKGKEFAEYLDKNYLSKHQLKSKFYEWTLTTINEYNKEWEKIGIPQKVIEKINSNHEPNVQRFLYEIDNIIFDDNLYPFYKIKIFNIFNVLRLLLEVTKNDFQDLIYRDKLNGDLVNCYYKGIPINDDEYKKLKNESN